MVGKFYLLTNKCENKCYKVKLDVTIKNQRGQTPQACI